MLGKGALLETGALQISWSVADDVGSSHVNPCVVDQRLFPGGGQIPASSHLKRFVVSLDSIPSNLVGKLVNTVIELVSKSRKLVGKLVDTVIELVSESRKLENEKLELSMKVLSHLMNELAE